MREIKFRAWHKEYKKYAYDIQDNYEYEPWKPESKFCYDLASFLNDPNIIVEQFTGLLDSKGREIYEGARIKYGKRGESAYDGIVEYDAPEFIVSPDLDIIACSPLSLVGYQNWYCEVIGNIHSSE